MGKTPEDIYHFFEFNESTQAEIVWKTIERIKKLEDALKEIAKSPQYRHVPNWVVIKCDIALKG